MKKISVIVPCYNCKSTIRRTVDSILGQTYSDFELILVDDKSTDETLELLYEIAVSNDKVKVIEKEQNTGQTDTCSKGVASAEGEYILFVDSDDYVDTDLLEKVVSELGYHQEVDMVVYGIQYEYPDGSVKPEKYFLGKEYYTKAEKEELLLPSYFTGDPQGGIVFCAHRSNKIFKREMWIDNMQDIDLRLKQGEDTISSFALFLSAKSIIVIPSYYPYHLCRRDDSTTEFKYDALQQFLVVQRSLKKRILENEKNLPGELMVGVDVLTLKGYLRSIKKWLMIAKWSELVDIKKALREEAFIELAEDPEVKKWLNGKEKMFNFALKKINVYVIKMLTGIALG